MSPRLKKFLEEAVCESIREELDDPISYDPKEASETYAAWGEAAAFFGFDLENVLKELGTGSEIKRFRQIMAGTYKE